MFRPSDTQLPLFDSTRLLTDRQRRICERAWPGVFRTKVLPLLRQVEGRFAVLFSPTEGRPNRPVEIVLGSLILKDLFDLTDHETLQHLDFDAMWWWAFQRGPEELELSQKTLHNFRAGLLQHEVLKQAALEITGELARQLGVDVSRQRGDSTHIVSNFAELTRLGMLCETLRLALKRLKEMHPGVFGRLGAGVLRRHGENSSYADARSKEGRRRLAVVARDLWRVLQSVEATAEVTKTTEWGLLKRAFDEQCILKAEGTKPKDDDDDAGDGPAPVELKPGKEVPNGSLQTPHDPDVTFSMHKGQGYEVELVETCHPDNAVRVILYEGVRPSSQHDSVSTVGIVKQLKEQGRAPGELVVDTTMGGGGPNAAALAELGVQRLAPAYAPVPEPIAGPLPSCPTDATEAARWLAQQEAQPEFRERYAIRAGIESTNSELKRAHGLGRLRVRGKARVELAVRLKVLACNLKRAMKGWLNSWREDRAAPGAAAAGMR
jgi:hypothetical protein